MDADDLISPTPPPDRMFRIALWLVAIFGAAQLAGLGVFYAGKWRADYAAAHPKVITQVSVGQQVVRTRLRQGRQDCTADR